LTPVTNKTYLEGIGSVNLKKSARAKYIRLKIDPEKGISVVVPQNIPEAAAIRFVRQKRAWIEKTMQKHASLKKQHTLFTESTEFHTRSHRLRLLKHPKKTIKSMVSGNEIVVWYPDFAEAGDSRIQAFIRNTIQETWRLEAKKYLPLRVRELANQFGFTYNKVSIKKAKTRWGSCSAKNNINLNIQLMRLPDPLIDYVILHELMHTREKNHQRSFWNKLEQILPGARQLDKRLNSYNLSIW
jgi:predicted metal-dependent hydrolase